MSSALVLNDYVMFKTVWDLDYTVVLHLKIHTITSTTAIKTKLVYSYIRRKN